MSQKSFPLRDYRTLRADSWWSEPLVTAAALIAFAAYVLWAAFQGEHYYAAPYLSPLYSPCLAARCEHVTIGFTGLPSGLSPAWLVLWIPLGLRATCYYYRKLYYRPFFLSPLACAVADARQTYRGESGFPLVLQNLHRYFFYLSLPVLVFVWWDASRAFRFEDGPGVGIGSLILFANAVLLSLFAASCNSCRHVCGGHVRSLHEAPLRHRAWKLTSVLNVRHAEYAWLSLASVVGADLYIRLLALGSIHDFRLI